MIYYIIPILIIIFLLFILFLILLKNKINKLEWKILQKFREKNNQIPCIYEITKPYINKHNEIFKELLILKRKDFSENLFYSNLLEKSQTYKLIHRELDFIFRVCNKHPKIEKNAKFLLIKDLIINKSNELWDNLVLYKSIVKKFNTLIFIKNISLIWILIPIKKIKSI